MTKSKGPGYGWRWLREGEARQKGDKTLGADGTWYFVTMHRVVSDNEYVARPIDPGEGYRLLGWEEALNSKHVEVTTDGFHWDVWQYGDKWDGDEPFIYVGELANHFKWLAARVPVEQKKCKTWHDSMGRVHGSTWAEQQKRDRIRDEALEEAANVIAWDCETIRDDPQLSQDVKSSLLFRLRCVETKIRKLKQGGQNAAISNETG